MPSVPRGARWTGLIVGLTMAVVIATGAMLAITHANSAARQQRLVVGNYETMSLMRETVIALQGRKSSSASCRPAICELRSMRVAPAYRAGLRQPRAPPPIRMRRGREIPRSHRNEWPAFRRGRHSFTARRGYVAPDRHTRV